MKAEDINIKTVPVGFATMAVVALWGAIEHPELPILWWIFGICATISGSLYLLWLWAQKHIAETKLKTERNRTNRAKQQAKHREKQLEKRASIDYGKTQRESMRYQRATLKKDTTLLDNAAKFIREQF